MNPLVTQDPEKTECWQAPGQVEKRITNFATDKAKPKFYIKHDSEAFKEKKSMYKYYNYLRS